MDYKEKNTELKFVIGRNDFYFGTINSKGSLYLAINTFILGGVINYYSAIFASCGSKYCAIILIALILAANFTSIICTLFSIKPYLNTKGDNENGSLLFFGDVADYHANQHANLWKEVTEEKYYQDLLKQSALLAKGLKSKFQYLNAATWAIAVQLFLITTLIMITLLNK